MVVACALPAASNVTETRRIAALMSSMVDARKRADLAAGPLVLASSLVLRGQLADPRRPVAECGPRPGTVTCPGTGAQQVVAGSAREERAAPGRVVAGVGDVLAGDPDRVAVHGCGAVVAPAGPRRVAADLLLVAREAVVHRESGGGVVPRSDARDRVDRRVCGTRVRGVAGVRERGHTDRGIREVVIGGAEVTLQRDLADVRIEDVPRDAGPLLGAGTGRVERRVERAPELAVRVHHLLHPGVVRVRPRDDLRAASMGRRADEQLPAPGTREGDRGLVVETVALRHVDPRSGP